MELCPWQSEKPAAMQADEERSSAPLVLSDKRKI